MKRAAILVAGAILASSAPIVSASPGAADTPGCVSRQEFYQVHRGMRMARVHHVFDTAGRLARRDAHRMNRYYKICGVPFTPRQAVHVVYRKHDGVCKLRRKWADAQ
jgi:hypothetical protein